MIRRSENIVICTNYLLKTKYTYTDYTIDKNQRKKARYMYMLKYKCPSDSVIKKDNNNNKQQN